MQADSVSVTGVSLPLSLWLWEALESRNSARLSQVCFLRPAQSLAMDTGIMQGCGPQKPPEYPATPVPQLPWEENVPDSTPISNLSMC